MFKGLMSLGAIHLWRPLKNRVFGPLPVHMRSHEPDPPTPLWTSTCGRHEIHIALLKQLVQWPSGSKPEIRLYDCNLFKTVLLVIYITNLYRRKFSTFYSVERRNSGKKWCQLLCMSRRQDDICGLYFKFSVWTSTWGLLPSPDHMRSPEPEPPPPLCGRHKWMAP